MAERVTYDTRAIARHFALLGGFVSAPPYGSGHINDTFALEMDQGGRSVRYVLQRINHNIFKNPDGLMRNVERVCRHAQAKLTQAGRHDASRRALTLVPTREGRGWYVDAHGNHWRCYIFVERATGHDVIRNADQAYQVGLIVDAMARGEIPERVTHNDTKLNNVLLDNETQEGICVIDLDTVMPGSALYDFGDLVRTSTSPAAEDETDLAKVTMQLPMFEALVKGYLATAGGFLTPAERALLPFAGKLITFEIGLRFLTDWLEGDVYFKIKRPRHNLDRLRTQFKLVESIEAQFSAMQALVR
jgi:hypothetical protein